MKIKMKKQTIFMAIVACFCASCTLDEIKEQGEFCPPKDVESGVLGYINDESCTADSCELMEDYPDYFTRRVCPFDYPACAKDGEGEWYCSKISCEVGQHVSKGKCVEDTLEACGSDNNKCDESIVGWRKGDCIEGKCVPSECKDKYELRDNKCQAKDGIITCSEGTHFYDDDCEMNTLEHCGEHDNRCDETPGWKDGVCSSTGQCIALECSDGYLLQAKQCVLLVTCLEGQHSNGTACENDTTEHCGSIEKNCAESEIGWLDGDCVEKKCVPSVCAEGYCIADNRCVDGSANSNACGIDGHACETCSDNLTCFEGICSESQCPADHHSYNGTCEPNSDANCGAHGVVCCAEIIEGSLTAACNGGLCRAVSCSETYHLFSNGCELNTNENCGNHGTVCSTETMPGSGEVSCSAGTCAATACIAGYHLFNGTCEADSISDCGSHGNACSVSNGTSKCENGNCGISSCNGGFHPVGLACEADSDSYCGDAGVICSVANGTSKCESGKCVLKSCNSGYHINGTTCEADSVSNCGSHGNACSVANGTPKCDGGKCGVSSCNTNFHINGTACEADSTSNCGSHGNACSVANGTPMCTNGNCGVASCSSGYHAYGTTCEADSNSNCGSHGNSCGNMKTCYSGTCRLTSCDSSVEGQTCYFSASSKGVCKTTGSTGGSDIKCVDATTRDTQCFMDSNYISCKNRTGASGTCIYDEAKASRYAGRSQHWICECSDTSQIFCLAEGGYKCVSSQSKCRYVYN